MNMDQELRIPAYALRDALAGALVGVTTDSTLPAFNHIKIQAAGDLVEFVSTDRYILIVGAVTPLDAYNTRDNWHGIDGLIHYDTAKRIISTLKTVPKSNKTLLVTLTLSGGTVTLSGLQDNVTVSGAYVDTYDFPKHANLWPDASFAGIDEIVHFNPTILAKLDKIPRTQNTAAALTLNSGGRAMLAELQHDAINWRVLIMPVRVPKP